MQRRTFIAALAAGAALPALGSAQPVMRHRRPMALPQMTGGPGEVTMTPWRNMPGVQVMVNGHGPYTFGIDTGFPGALNVTPAVAQAAGLPVVGQEQASDPSGLNPVTMSTYRVSSLAIGPLTFGTLDAGGFPPLPSSVTGPPLDGLIGMGLFHASTLVLDFPGHKVAVADAAVAAPDQRTIFGYPRGDLIDLPLTIGTVTLRAHLDTGQSRVPLLVPQEAIARLATHGEPRAIGVAHTISQTLTMFAVAIDAPVRLGDITFAVTEVAYPTPVPIANIGAAAVQSMVLKLDGRTGRVQFVPGA